MTDPPLFAALDVSRQSTANCIVDADGANERECTTPSKPEAIAAVLDEVRD